MPPKKQITKEQIIEKAFEIVRSEGFDTLTARYLGKELNCSTQPIYQAFTDMNELKRELIKKAWANLLTYIQNSSEKDLPIGLSYILSYVRFAMEEKHLFQLIFTSGNLNLVQMNNMLPNIIGIDLNMIVYANGIVMMTAFHSIDTSPEKIREMIINAYHLFYNSK